MPKRAALIALLAVFVVCAGTVRGSELQTVRVGVCLSLTGGFAESGRKALAGVRMRVEDFNAGDTGLRIELVVRDDRSDPAAAAAAAEELMTVEKVPAIIGPLSTSLMREMLPVARRHRVVLISPSVTSPEIGRDGDWGFRLLFDDEFQGVALARFVRRTLGLTRAGAIINEKFAYAESVFRAFKENFEKEGGEIVAEERYSWVVDEERMFDFSGILERITRARPEMVLLPLHSPEVAAVIRESTMAGVRTRFCGGDTWQHEVVLLSSGNNLENSYFISGIDFQSGTPEMRRFLDLYDHSNDPAAQPTSVLGYDAASLLIEALGNGADGESIREGLYGIRDFRLATGTITIDRGRGSEKSAYIHRISEVDNHFESKIVDEIKP